MSLSTFLTEAFAKSVCGTATTISGDGNLYLILLSAAPTGGGSSFSEISYGGYSRKQITSVDVTGRVATLDVNILFDAATEEWTSVPYWGIINNSTGGNLWGWGQFFAPVTISTGNQLLIKSNVLKVTAASGPFTDTLCETLLTNAFINMTCPDLGIDYIGLSTTQPNADGTGVTEPSGGNYSRETFTDWATGVVPVLNNSDITFNVPSASWGTIGWVVGFDASSGGNVMYYDEIAHQLINSGNIFEVVAGEFDITCS
jgi:hypothetical protein